MMQFLLIGFHSVGKASKLIFLPDGAIFSGLVYKGSIKQILALFLFSIGQLENNTAIIVWVCWYGCQSVVCMYVIKKIVCVRVCSCKN